MDIKKTKKIFSRIKNAFPSDVRETLFGFLSSSAMIVLALFALSLAFDGGDTTQGNENDTHAPVATGFEPYAVLLDVTEASAAPSISTSDELKTDVLSRFVEEKAGGESYAVRVAFAAVALNRVKSERFGSTVSAVLREAGVYGSDVSVTVSERTKNAVRDALLGVDPTFGALYVADEDDERINEPEYEQRTLAHFGGYVFLE